jgi:hypothetical protein
MLASNLVLPLVPVIPMGAEFYVISHPNVPLLTKSSLHADILLYSRPLTMLFSCFTFSPGIADSPQRRSVC